MGRPRIIILLLEWSSQLIRDWGSLNLLFLTPFSFPCQCIYTAYTICSRCTGLNVRVSVRGVFPAMSDEFFITLNLVVLSTFYLCPVKHHSSILCFTVYLNLTRNLRCGDTIETIRCTFG